MKRIFICLSIASLSVMGLYAQENEGLKQQQDLKAYQQEKATQLQLAIRTQTQLYISEATNRMDARKREVQNEVDARREQLMYRPSGMASLNVK